MDAETTVETIMEARQEEAISLIITLTIVLKKTLIKTRANQTISTSNINTDYVMTFRNKN